MSDSLFDQDRAVSPVIGVLLMVAVTVILAAVIGTFVLNLGGGVNENVKAGASVSVTEDEEVKVTWNSNQNANELDVSITGCDTASTTLVSVGESWTSSTSCSDGDTAVVLVTAIGNGDAETVIVNRDVGI